MPNTPTQQFDDTDDSISTTYYQEFYRYPKVNITMFSGNDNDDVDAWITELNDIRQMDIFPPHQLFIRAKQMLAGKAKFIVRITEPQVATLDELLRVLKAQFSRNTDEALLEKLKATHQTHEEKLSTFVDKMLTVASRCMEISQSEIIKLIIRNANNIYKPTLMCIHDMTPFRNIHEIASKARQLEEKYHMEKQQTIPPSIAKIIQSEKPTAQNGILCDFCYAKGHSSTDCRTKRRADEYRKQQNQNTTAEAVSKEQNVNIAILADNPNVLTAVKRRAVDEPQRPVNVENTSNKAIYYRTQRGPYSVKEDLQNTKANITFAQLFDIAPTVRQEFATIESTSANFATLNDDQVYTAVTTTAIIGNQEVLVVLDSGAALSIMTVEMAKRLNLPIETAHGPPIIGVHNSKTPSAGIIRDVSITVAACTTRINFIVVKACPAHIILGTNWCRQTNAIMDFGKSTVTIHCGDQVFTIPITMQKAQTQPQNMALHISFETEEATCPKTLPSTLFKNYAHIFRPTSDTIKFENAYHYISTTDEKPIKCTPYRLSSMEHQFVNKAIQELLETNRISPSKSNYSSPIVLVKKKSGDLRLCIDFRKLNQLTVRDNYPLPHIDIILDQFFGAKIFSSLDLANGYWQIPVHADDRHKTAFITQKGLYEWNVMPFGLCNAPATFQRIMHNVFSDLIGKFVLVYIDDIIIYSRSLEEHLQHVTIVFDLISDVNIRLNPTKCDFFSEQLTFLGHIVSVEGIKPDPKKIVAIQNISQPKNTKEVQSFLGLANFYRRFIQNFAEKAKPLHEITRQKIKFKWEKSEQEAFDALKEALKSAPLRHHPDLNGPFILQTDASSIALGAILMQEENSKPYVINYNSRLTNKAESKYTASELECLAIIWGIKINRHYLALSTFTVITDHKALQWLHNNKDLNSRLLRWNLKLQDYNFIIKYKPGISNIADPLSRLISNNTCLTAVNEEDIRSAHESCGHGGLGATLHILNSTSSEDSKLAASIIRNCKVCQQYNPRNFRSKAIPVFSAGPFHRLEIDTVGPITSSISGNCYLLVAVDHFTRWTEACAASDKSALTVAKFIVEHIIFRHGAPSILQSDNGLEFNNNVVQNICNILEITKKNSSPYRPQTNGLVEKTNHTLILKLAKIVQSDWIRWDQYLSQAVFAVNISRNRITGHSPFELLYGRTPILPSLFLAPVVTLDTTNAQDDELYRQIGSQNRAPSQIPGNIGDHVLVRLSTPSDKLKPKWVGGYHIIGKRCNSYRLSDGYTERTMHASNVRLVGTTSFLKGGEIEGDIS